MNGIAKLKEKLAGYLKGQPGLEKADILDAWPSKRPLPLKAPAITVGLEGIELTPAGLGGYAEHYGSTASVTMRFDMFVPDGYPDAEPAACLHALYEALGEALAKGAVSFGLARVWCDAPGWDNAANAGCLTARASLRAALTFGESCAEPAAPGFTDFTLRSELIV